MSTAEGALVSADRGIIKARQKCGRRPRLRDQGAVRRCRPTPTGFVGPVVMPREDRSSESRGIVTSHRASRMRRSEPASRHRSCEQLRVRTERGEARYR